MSADRHKQQRVYWRPPGHVIAWLKTEAQKQGTTVTAILNKAVAEYERQSNGRTNS